jgi:hypothetical protein
VSDLSERVSPVVASALRLVASARQPTAEVVAKALGECLRVLGAQRPDPGIVALHLGSATASGSALIAAGVLPVDLAQILAAARNMVLEGSAAPRRLADTPFIETENEPFLVAATEVPALREVHRSAAALEGSDEDDKANDEPTPAEATESAGQDEEEVGALVDVAPPRLEWLEAPNAPYVPPQPVPPVRVGEGGEARPLRDFYCGVVRSALETGAMLARHNADRPQRERRESEKRILALSDAAIASGPECANACLSWWDASVESPDPWKAWAPTFVLGCLAGDDTLAAVKRRLEMLGDKPAGAGTVIAEALSVAPHPAVPRLVRELLASSRPLARAAGIDLASLRSLLSADDLRIHLCDANRPVLVAALRAAPRAADSESLAQYVLPLMHYPDRGVSWEAARALALWGRPEPYRDVRNRGKLATILGPRTLDLLVLYGEHGDLAMFEAYLKSFEVTSATLSCVARFGHPLSWAFLLHFLAEEDFVDNAIQALLTMFGPMVPEEKKQRKNVSAWRDAISRARLDPAQRYAGGQPWSPQRVVEECRRGRINRHEVERRIDELAVRLREPLRVDMARWSPQREAELASVAATISDKHNRWLAGSWACASRR